MHVCVLFQIRNGIYFSCYAELIWFK